MLIIHYGDIFDFELLRFVISSLTAKAEWVAALRILGHDYLKMVSPLLKVGGSGNVYSTKI